MAKSTDLTDGVIWRQLAKYAAPLVVSNILQSMYNMADMIIAGKFIGVSSISAISNSGTLMNMITLIIVGLTTGGNIIISQCFGARDKKGMKDAATTLLLFALILGALLAISFHAAAGSFLMALRAPAMEEATLYLRTCAIGLVFVAAYNAGSAMLRAIGNSRAPLICVAITSCINILLDIIFVIVFDLGIFGTALATVISQGVSAIVAVTIVCRSSEVLGLKLSQLYIKKESLKIILKLGIPVAVQKSVASISWLSVAFLINSHGLVISSGNGISIKIKEFCQLFLSAMSLSTASMTAQNLGAKKFERAREVMYTSIKFSLCIAAVIVIIIEIFAPQIVRLFTDDPATARAAVQNLRIEILAQFFYAVTLNGHAMMIGSGSSWFAFFSSFINCIIFRVPLAFILNHFFGVTGLYLACMIAPASSIPFILWYVRSNRWRRSLAKDSCKLKAECECERHHL